MFVFRITCVGRFRSHNNSPSIFNDVGLLPPWHRRLCFWPGVFGSVGFFVCLFVDNITQKVMNRLG